METLFFKEKNISNANVELIFHKDYTHIFNDSTLHPIIKYTLFNCQNIDKLNFTEIDSNNDGVTINTETEANLIIFQIDDGWNEYKVFCENVKKEELEYRSKDLVDIIKSVKKENDNQYEQIVSFVKKFENLKTHFSRELTIIDKKLEQATWLTEEKKQALIAEKGIIIKAIQLIEFKQAEEPNIIAE